ncbi:MAG: flagellar filament capping protein FliD [Thermodesulfobacteria bacterium]|nr:flagellar filament capping protein FliD [Thermodesulfobacteriota bacterium]
MSDFYISNLTGTLDIDSMVQGLLQPKLQNVKRLQTEKAKLEAVASSISNLLGALKDAQSEIDGWDIDSLFSGKKVDVADDSILTATASKDTPDVSLTLTVDSLAQTEVRVSSNGVTDLNDTIPAATFTLTYWTSDTDSLSYTINFGGGTLQDLVDAINSAQDKVEASIFYDGTSYKLMLSEKDPGASTKETTDTSAVIEVDSNFPLGTLDTLQNATNAKLEVGTSGTIVTSPTNTFENVITGLNVTVSQTGSTTVTIEEDYSQATDTVKDFLDKINGVIDLINKSTGKGKLFQGNVMVTQLKTQFFSLMQPLIKLGVINLDENGKYSLNESAFLNQIENNPDEVKLALSQIQTNFKSVLDQLVSSFEAYKEAQDRQIRNIDNRIKEMQEALKKEEIRLRIQFAKIEDLMYQNDQLRQKLQNFAVPLSQVLNK